MTAQTAAEQRDESLSRRLRELLDDPVSADDGADWARRMDEFADGIGEIAGELVTIAAWCRLGAAIARGEDVPDSIHPQAGESAEDTTRWRKWRVSSPDWLPGTDMTAE